MHVTSVRKTSAHSHNTEEMHTHKHTPSRSPGLCGLVLERASFLRLRQRKPGTNRGPGTAASKPQEALVLSLPVEGVGAWGASCMCFHSQGQTGINCVCVCHRQVRKSRELCTLHTNSNMRGSFHMTSQF